MYEESRERLTLAIAEALDAYHLAQSVRADTRTPRNVAPLVERNGKLCAPQGCVLDDEGVVRKVLGTLPVTADGCVAEYGRTYWCLSHVPIFDGSGPGASSWRIDIVEKTLESTEPSEEYTGDWTSYPPSCFSTREAAEAAREVPRDNRG
jgi:hypothetical protein